MNMYKFTYILINAKYFCTNMIFLYSSTTLCLSYIHAESKYEIVVSFRSHLSYGHYF